MPLNIMDLFEEQNTRPYQESIIKAIYDLFTQGYEYVMADVPGGVGKTVIGKTIANSFMKTHYFTNSKGLQNQINAKYGDVPKVMGRGNFVCLSNLKVRCDKGPCQTENEFKCSFKPDIGALSITKPDNFIDFDIPESEMCEYWKQKIEAIQSKISSHNYTYILNELNYVGHFALPRVDTSFLELPHDLSTMTLGIFDEAHNLESQILSFYSIEFNIDKLQNLQIEFPTPFPQNDKEWIKWLVNVKELQIPASKKQLKSKLKNAINSQTILEIGRLLNYLSSTKNKIDKVIKTSSQYKNMWKFVPKLNDFGNIISFSVLPVYTSPLTEETIFFNYDKKLIMSATLLGASPLMKYLKLPPKKTAYFDCPCPYPLNHRPIYIMNIASMKYSKQNRGIPNIDPTELNKLIDSVDAILNHPDFVNKKGIIHTTTFELANFLKKNLSPDNQTRLITHGKSDKFSSTNYITALSKHITSDSPTVLASPSIMEGVDLDADKSEFQIVLKLPYQSTSGSPQLETRKEIDPNSYEWNSVVKSVQSTCRSVRSMNDIAPTFHLDSRFLWYIDKNSALIPKWWKDSIKYIPHKYSGITESINKKYK